MRLIKGDAINVLRKLPAASVQCVVTSPPYWGLRDYGTPGQLGLEASPDEYIAKMVGVFREVWRVLRDDGTCFVNMGDSYGPGKQLMGMPWRLAFGLQADAWILRSDIVWHKPNPMPESVTDRPAKSHEYVFLLSKSQRYYFDSLAVREKVGQLTRRQKTFRGGCYTENKAFDNSYDYSGHAPYSDDKPSLSGRNIRSVWTIPTQSYKGAHFATFPRRLVRPCIAAGTSERGCCPVCGAGWVRVVEKGALQMPRGPRSDFRVRGDARRDCATRTDVQPIPGAFRLNTTTGWRPTCSHDVDPVPCIVLDPFAGSGTTGAESVAQGRGFIGIDLSREYLKLARARIKAAAALAGA